MKQRMIQPAQPSQTQPRISKMEHQSQPKVQQVVHTAKPAQSMTKAQTMPPKKQAELSPTPHPQTKRKKRLIKKPKHTVRRYRL